MLLTVQAACAVLVSCGEPESRDNAYPSQTDGQAAYQAVDEQTSSPDISSADTSETFFQPRICLQAD